MQRIRGEDEGVRKKICKNLSTASGLRACMRAASNTERAGCGMEAPSHQPPNLRKGEGNFTQIMQQNILSHYEGILLAF